MATSMTQSKRMVGAVTPQMYEEVLGELDTATEQLNKIRAELWEAQDELKEAKGYKLKWKAQEKLCAEDKETIRTLEQQYGKSLKKERETQDAFDLMKKVFTRTQLKAKDDQTVIQDLKEVNRLLTEKNLVLLQSLKDVQEELSGAEETTKEEKAIAEKLLSENYESIEVGKKLASKLKETKRDLEKERANQKAKAEKSQNSEKDIKASNNRIAEEATTKIQEQQKEIKKLKKQLSGAGVEKKEEQLKAAGDENKEEAGNEKEQESKEESEEVVDSSSAVTFFSQLGFAACNPCLTAPVAV